MAAQKLRDRMGGNMPTPPAKVNRHVVDNPPNSAAGPGDTGFGRIRGARLTGYGARAYVDTGMKV